MDAQVLSWLLPVWPTTTTDRCESVGAVPSGSGHRDRLSSAGCSHSPPGPLPAVAFASAIPPGRRDAGPGADAPCSPEPALHRYGCCVPHLPVEKLVMSGRRPRSGLRSWRTSFLLRSVGVRRARFGGFVRVLERSARRRVVEDNLARRQRERGHGSACPQQSHAPRRSASNIVIALIEPARAARAGCVEPPSHCAPDLAAHVGHGATAAHWSSVHPSSVIAHRRRTGRHARSTRSGTSRWRRCRSSPDVDTRPA
jgi:hypothetical protein